jgi:hypothetical protein
MWNLRFTTECSRFPFPTSSPLATNHSSLLPSTSGAPPSVFEGGSWVCRLFSCPLSRARKNKSKCVIPSEVRAARDLLSLQVWAARTFSRCPGFRFLEPGSWGEPSFYERSWLCLPSVQPSSAGCPALGFRGWGLGLPSSLFSSLPLTKKQKQVCHPERSPRSEGSAFSSGLGRADFLQVPRVPLSGTRVFGVNLRSTSGLGFAFLRPAFVRKPYVLIYP